MQDIFCHIAGDVPCFTPPCPPTQSYCTPVTPAGQTRILAFKKLLNTAAGLYKLPGIDGTVANIDQPAFALMVALARAVYMKLATANRPIPDTMKALAEQGSFKAFADNIPAYETLFKDIAAGKFATGEQATTGSSLPPRRWSLLLGGVGLLALAGIVLYLEGR